MPGDEGRKAPAGEGALAEVYVVDGRLVRGADLTDEQRAGLAAASSRVPTELRKQVIAALGYSGTPDGAMSAYRDALEALWAWVTRPRGWPAGRSDP